MSSTQTNTEYFFRLLYDCLHGACYGSLSGIEAFLSHLWLWIVGIGYTVSVVALFIIVYCTVRLFELRHREEEFYSTPLTVAASLDDEHPRWQHIKTLAAGTTSSEWRDAIIEADIMLDDVLVQQGYVGEGVAEKLKTADNATFGSLNDAWEAHKVRNQIAHEGSAFDLSETLAQRTIARYEAVFREFKVI